MTRAELLDAEVTREEIKQRLRRGTLIREHPGVYRVGHQAPSVEARNMAAVKACGKGAVLSGRAAGYVLGLLKGKPPPEVTAPTERKVRGVKPRRTRLPSEETTVWNGIPITTVPRTLVDLAATLSLTALARACHEAGVNHRTTPRQVEEVLQRQPNAKGAKKLRAVLRGDAR